MALLTKRRSTDYIAIHCSATPAARDIGRAEIEKMHRDRGFVTIGYHFVIRRDGTVETGRPVDTVGAHVKSYNSISVGVCLVGGVTPKLKAENNYTPEQWASLATVVEDLRGMYPHAKILGHRDFPAVAKDCPCFDVKEWAAAQGF